jgi:hypothetical protein
MLAIHVTLAQMKSRLPKSTDKRHATFSESYNESDGRTEDDVVTTLVPTPAIIVRAPSARYGFVVSRMSAVAKNPSSTADRVVDNLGAIVACVDNFANEINVKAFNAMAQYLFDWNVGILDPKNNAVRVRIPKNYEIAAIAKFAKCFSQNSSSGVFLDANTRFPVIYSFATTAGNGRTPAQGDLPHKFSLHAPGSSNNFETSLSPKIPVVKFWKSADDNILRCVVYMLTIFDNTNAVGRVIMPEEKITLDMLETITDDINRSFPESSVRTPFEPLINFVEPKLRAVVYADRCVKYDQTPDLDVYFDINLMSRAARAVVRKLPFDLTQSNVLSDEHVAELTRRFHVAAAIKHN